MIAVDVGNTLIHFVKVKTLEKISQCKSIPTKTITLRKIATTIASFGQDKVLVCSVVPKITKLFVRLQKRIVGAGPCLCPVGCACPKQILIVGKDLSVPIKSLYNKKSIGMDRLVAAFAAKELYLQIRLVIDFGTAITFDFISPKGVYQGGVILPGVGSTLNVLSSCAMLPNKIRLKKVKGFIIPRDTKESINLGMQEGFSAMINSLVAKYKKKVEFSSKDKIVVTGGDGMFIKASLNFPLIYEKNLVFKGLFLLGT